MSRPWVAAPAAPLADAFRLAFSTAASWKHGRTLIFALQDRQQRLTIPAACSDDEVPLQPADSMASDMSFPSDTDSISGVHILGPALQAVDAARTWPCSHSHRCCRSRLWRTTAPGPQGSMIEPRPLKIAMQQASQRLTGSHDLLRIIGSMQRDWPLCLQPGCTARLQGPCMSLPQRSPATWTSGNLLTWRLAQRRSGMRPNWLQLQPV